MRNPIRRWLFRRTTLTPAERLTREIRRYARAQGVSEAEVIQGLARLNPVKGRSASVPLNRAQRRAKARSG